ncbi:MULTISPECIES: YceI family protein [Hymenobacter]|uniref:YceI family protein n=1 Tax=Hymenobacter jejuensis TaxID=2502781 RepID=A0A5B7ZZ92_9BACT|nr:MULTISPECIES: YceI family protein [Hymenobacter]MBC6988484.1 YceI family protein [Hymenobacter sp. BT491]QDA59162.1 YceI family protein [Hymenobacter jejuensis]
MKKIALSALVVATLFTSSTYAENPAATKTAPRTTKAAGTVYKLQPQLSTLGWDAKAVTHGHNGTLQFSDGQLVVKGNQLIGGTATVDMKTLKATDITDAENNGKFMGHMNSDDFFSIAKYPTATFKITSVTPIKGAAANANNATITGDLTIKGKTNPVTFPAKVGVKNGVAAASGTATIDRTKYDIKYGSKSFFEGIGDKAIYDEFTLNFNVIAKQ